MEQEDWKKVQGFGWLYSASTLGRVRRDDTGRVLSGNVNPQGYRQLHISVSGVKYCVMAHKMVLLAFVGPCPDGMEGCHADGDQLNNRPDNLRWDTHLSNQRDRRAHGNYATGEAHPMSKLTEDQARSIMADTRPTKAIAAEYGVSFGTVQGIKGGQIWGHLEGERVPVAGFTHEVRARGERVGGARLTADAVRAIRADPRATREIAEEYGVHRSSILFIKAGKTWQHVA